MCSGRNEAVLVDNMPSKKNSMSIEFPKSVHSPSPARRLKSTIMKATVNTNTPFKTKVTLRSHIAALSPISSS